MGAAHTRMGLAFGVNHTGPAESCFGFQGVRNCHIRSVILYFWPFCLEPDDDILYARTMRTKQILIFCAIGLLVSHVDGTGIIGLCTHCHFMQMCRLAFLMSPEYFLLTGFAVEHAVHIRIARNHIELRRINCLQGASALAQCLHGEMFVAADFLCYKQCGEWRFFFLHSGLCLATPVTSALRWVRWVA